MGMREIHRLEPLTGKPIVSTGIGISVERLRRQGDSDKLRRDNAKLKAGAQKRQGQTPA